MQRASRCVAPTQCYIEDIEMPKVAPVNAEGKSRTYISWCLKVMASRIRSISTPVGNVTLSSNPEGSRASIATCVKDGEVEEDGVEGGEGLVRSIGEDEPNYVSTFARERDNTSNSHTLLNRTGTT